MKYELNDCVEKLIPELSEYFIKDNGDLNVNVTLPADGVIYLNYLYALNLFEKDDVREALKARVKALWEGEPLDWELFKHFQINTVFNQYTRLFLTKEKAPK